MIGLEGKSLFSSRLCYRLLSGEDKEALAEILSEPEVTEPAGFRVAKSQEEFDEFFAGLTAYNTALGIYLGDTLIGYVHVNKETSDDPALKDKPCVSVGFVIGTPWHRQGYGAEMLKTVTDYLLTRFAACYADCFPENEASRKTIEKCGYHYVEDYTFFFQGLGEEKTCHSYVRLAEPNVQTKPE